MLSIGGIFVLAIIEARAGEAFETQHPQVLFHSNRQAYPIGWRNRNSHINTWNERSFFHYLQESLGGAILVSIKADWYRARPHDRALHIQ